MSETITTKRLDNGVRARMDGRGSVFGNMHREKLGNEYLMADMDGCFGFVAWGQNTAERIFLEYVPDGYENKGKAIRHFAVVAIFDKKKTNRAAGSDGARLSESFYLDIWLSK
jgi:hypothetical protein